MLSYRPASDPPHEPTTSTLASHLKGLGWGFWLPVALMAAAIALILTLPVALRGDAEQTAQQLLLVLGFLGIGGVFGWVGLHTRRSGLRRAWLAWSLTWFSVGAAQVFNWLLLSQRIGHSSALGLEACFSIISYACTVVAISSLPSAYSAPSRRWQIWLDGSVLACGCIGGSWYFILGPLIFDGTGTVLERATNLGYALGNIAIVIALLLLLLRGVERAFRPTFFILLAGMFCPLIADTFFAIFQAHSGADASSSAVQVSSLVGAVVMAVAPLYHLATSSQCASLDQQGAQQLGGRRVSRTYDVSPFVTYLPIIGLNLLAASDSFIPGVSDNIMRVVDLIAVLAVILVVTRQLLTIKENVRLLHDQQWALQAEEFSRSEAEKTNARLREANVELQILSEKATESARLKSEFLANMSHEIRTPMNGIIGMTELALQGRLEPEVADYLNTAHDSALALLTVLNDILDFSKVEAGRLELESVDFDPRMIVESVAGLLAPKAAEKRLELMTETASDMPATLLGDPLRLRQILLNLAGNSIKFTERGHIVIRVRREAQPSDDASDVRLRFEVTDTGIGVSEEARGRLFQAFTQADGSTTRKYGGTGLGLSISKRLVELMGGEIGVESVEGRGSTFWFVVPFAVAESSASRQTESAPIDELRGRRALIVDDNDVQCEILRHYFATWGVEVEAVSDGAAALERLRLAADARRPFDVALLDLMLPRMDGFSLAQAIRLDPRLVATPLALMTAYDEVGLGRQALHVGFTAYLTKPIKRDALLTALLRVFGSGYVSEPGEYEPSHEAPQSMIDTASQALRFAGRRILLAEDNLINRKLANLQLRQLGCDVTMVNDGRAAVEREREGHYELVLMDCHMPEMDGFEATAAIRGEEAERGGHVPIIAMTADALQGDRERCLAAGMDDYISKPVTLEDLSAALLRQLPRRPAKASREERPATPRSETAPSAPDSAGEPEHSMAQVTREPTEAAALSSASLNGRLLLVEDNAVNQHLMALQLARLGCAIDIAANGREALVKLGERDYALVLMDCNMPVMDGYEATARIREIEAESAARHVPIIAVTANALRGDREKAIRAGMDDYLPKPIKLPELHAALSHWGAVSASDEQPTLVPAATPNDDTKSANGLEPLEQAQIEAIRSLQAPGEPDILAEVFKEFALDAAELLEQMRQALTEDDLPTLHRAAHSLKSSSAYLGAKTLAAVCADLEHLCATAIDGHEEIPGDAPPLVAQIETAYRRVLLALDDARRPQASPTNA